MDEINIPENLGDLSVSALQELLDQVNEAGKTTADAANEAAAGTPERKELVETLNTLKTAKENLTEALNVAKEAEAAEAEAIAEASKAFDPDGDDDEEEDDDATTTEGSEADDAEATSDAEAEDKEVVTASGKISIPKRKARRQVPDSERELRQRVNQPFANAGGDRIESLKEFGDLMLRAGKGIQRNGDLPIRVGRMNRFDELGKDQHIEGNDAWRNHEILMGLKPMGENDEITMAAGGFCGPADAIRQIEECGRTDRPIAALLGTGFSARGKYRRINQVGLEDVDAGITYWSEADDIAADPDNPASLKPCYHLECAEEIEAVPVGIPMCFTYGTFQQWSNPEQVAATLAKFDVALARRSERLVLQRIHEQSNQYSWAPPVGESLQNGLTRLVSQLLQIAGYNGRNDLTGYVLGVPEALILQMLTDARIKAWVGPTLTRADIMAGLEDTFQIRVVESPDVRVNAPAPVEPLPAAPAPAGGAVPCPHTRLEVQLFKPADFKHTVSDVDIAVQTSIDQARANDKSVSLETIETTEKIGCSPAFSVLYDGLAVTGSQPDLVAADEDYCPGPTPEPYGNEGGAPDGDAIGGTPVGFPGSTSY